MLADKRSGRCPQITPGRRAHFRGEAQTPPGLRWFPPPNISANPGEAFPLENPKLAGRRVRFFVKFDRGSYPRPELYGSG